MKKVLIITYYWPPSGGAGVQRWLKMAKYLRKYNWEPVIYTPLNPEPPDVDYSLLSDIPENLTVIKKKILEPYGLYRRFTSKRQDAKIAHAFLNEGKKPGLSEKFAVWVRGNFFIPDARCFWVKPSIRFLTNYLATNPVDAIVSTGPPHSMHLIALGVKEKTGVPWLADFRDPWTEIDYFGQLHLTTLAHTEHRKLEKKVLASADSVVTVNPQLASDLNRLGAANTQVITNGFDEDDFSFLPANKDPGFILTHIGSLNKDRNPEKLWEALARLRDSNTDFNRELKLRFIGKNDYSLKESLLKHGLISRTEFFDYLPHQEALQLAARSSALLLLLNNTPNVKGITPGKLFEYLALRLPIVCVGPVDGESAQIIAETKTGFTVDFDDTEQMQTSIFTLYRKYSSGTLSLSITIINKYSRSHLAQQIAAALDEIL